MPRLRGPACDIAVVAGGLEVVHALWLVWPPLGHAAIGLMLIGAGTLFADRRARPKGEPQ